MGLCLLFGFLFSEGKLEIPLPLEELRFDGTDWVIKVPSILFFLIMHVKVTVKGKGAAVNNESCDATI